MTRQAGFSLVEILVAVAVFATVSAMSVALLAQGLRAQKQTQRKIDQVATAQRISSLLRFDVGQLVPRSVRKQDGMTDPILFRGGSNDFSIMPNQGEGDEILVLTRTGWTNPGHIHPRSTLQRVRWLYDGKRLWREASAYPDEAPTTLRLRQLVGDDLLDVSFEFYNGKIWVPSYYAMVSDDELTEMPRAVRIRYRLAGIGDMEHIALIANAEGL